MTREPLVRTRQKLRDLGVDQAVISGLEERLRDEVFQASARALAAPLADPSTVKEHLYA
jgi:TPP-dependent pyruvate/acetoin dehydrogenase alpha subunit